MNNEHALPDSVRRLASHQWAAGGKIGEYHSLGAPELDGKLQGGLPKAALHEMFGDNGQGVAASAFALLLALRLAGDERPLLWIRDAATTRHAGQIYPPGLVHMGARPDAIILVETRDPLESLRVASDAIRSRAPSAILLDAYGTAPAIDLTATRRLSLAATQAGVLALLVRMDAKPVPSAAYSRWQVKSAPSRPLPADAPGHPVFALSLLRHRGGVAPFEAHVEWNHEQRSFRDAPLSRHPSAVAPGGEADTAAYPPERQSA